MSKFPMDYGASLGNAPKLKLPTGSIVKIALLGGAVLIIFLGGLALYDSLRGNAEGVVTLEFSKPDRVAAGAPFSVTVSLSNISDQALKDARLILTLPDDISFLGGDMGRRTMEQSVGDLGPGRLNQQTFNLIALGGAQTLKRLEARFLYRIPGSTAQFEEASDIDIPVAEQAIELTMEVPKRVVSGEEFEIKLAYENKAAQAFRDVKIQLEYPPIFEFEESNLPAADRSNTAWELGDIAEGERGELVITGSAAGPSETFFGFNARVFASFLGQLYTVGEKAADLAIATSPLSLEITLNGDREYVARIDEPLTYDLRFTNNSDIAFENLILKAELIGDIFDFSSVRADAAFNSLSNTLTWSLANSPSLARLLPGESGEVQFDVDLKEQFPIRRLGDKNFMLKVRGEVQSPTVPVGTATLRTVTLATHEAKVSGNLLFDAQTFFFDPESGILNSGVYPPKVNQPTQYTVHWVVSNEAVDVSNMKIESFVQSGGRWTGVVKSNTDTAPTYDPNTGRVQWFVGNLPANRGIVSTPAEAIFQIEVTPAINQIGQYVNVISDTRAEGQDAFTGRILYAQDDAQTTEIEDDVGASSGDRRVVP